MIRSSRLLAVVALGVTVVVTGCSTNDDVDSLSATYGVPNTPQDVEAHEWVLQPTSTIAPGPNPATFAVRGDTASGAAPCNRYRGHVEIDDESIDVRKIATSLRACDRATMRAEEAFLAALRAVDTIDDVTDTKLVLTNERGLRLVFRAFDADELIEGRWSIVNFATGGALESALPGTEPSITFRGDGDVNLATGCNTAASSWSLDGKRLSIDPMRTTQKLCSDPRGVMDQEAALVRAVESSDRVEITPTTLTILASSGRILIVAERLGERPAL